MWVLDYGPGAHLPGAIVSARPVVLAHQEAIVRGENRGGIDDVFFIRFLPGRFSHEAQISIRVTH